MKAIAYCAASGQIYFGPTLPRGFLPIASGEADALRRFIEGAARRAYDGSPLVPGLPEIDESDDKTDALEVLKDFIDKIAPHAPEGVSVIGASKLTH